MLRRPLFRPLLFALLALAVALQGSAGLLARSAADDCPLEGHDCCQALRVTCCDEAPAPNPATAPGGQQTLRAPVSSVAPLSLAFATSTALDVTHAAPPAAASPPRLLDLPVFLHVLLI